MTPAEFAALGRLAWGAAWQRPMAAALGVSRHTVASMSVGRVSVRESHALIICAALLVQADRLVLAAEKLREAT